jgi:PAS domain S-box-containing protein
MSKSNFDKLEILEAVFEHMPQAVLIADDDGCYVEVNKAAEKLLGIPREKILGRKISDFVAPINQKNAVKLWERFVADGLQSGTFVISRADGTDRIIDYVAKLNFLPGLHLSVALDVTESQLKS